MSQHAVEEALGRLITDSEFRRLFYMDPAATCQRESLDLTAREMDALVALNASRLQAMARVLDTRIVRATVGGTHYWGSWARGSHGPTVRRSSVRAVSIAGLTRGPK
jgi:hypothetical protein